MSNFSFFSYNNWSHTLDELIKHDNSKKVSINRQSTSIITKVEIADTRTFVNMVSRNSKSTAEVPEYSDVLAYLIFHYASFGIH